VKTAIFIKLIGLLASLVVANFSVAEPLNLDEGKVACRIWKVPYRIDVSYDGGSGSMIGSGTLKVESNALVDSNTMAVGLSDQYSVTGGPFTSAGVVLSRKQLLNNTLGGWKDSLELGLETKIRATLLNHFLANDAKIVCLAIGVETSLITNQVRNYLEKNQRQIIENQISDEITKTTTLIKQSNEAKRTEILERLLKELPNNTNLVEALRRALLP
jgi:hypothetical protein